MKKFLSFLLIIVIVISTTACSDTKQPTATASGQTSTVAGQATSAISATSGSKSSTKDTFVWAAPFDPISLNFVKDAGNATSIVLSYVTNYLVDRYFEKDGSVSVGVCDKGLATSYKFDDNNMGVTFKLRQGVKFQNGTEFKAKDAVFSVAFFAAKAGYEFIDYKNTKAIDDYTLYVPFVKLDGSALTKLSLIPMWSAEYYEKVNRNDVVFFKEKPIGTGPFKITEWVTDDHIYTERFDGYFEGPAILKRFNTRVITQNNVALAELQTGGVDYILRGSGNDVSDVRAGMYGKNITVFQTENEDSLSLQFNNSLPIMQNIKFKQAICTAIDRSTIVKAAFGDGGTDSWTVLSNRTGQLTKYEGNNWFYPYNVDKAKSLLAEAGFKDSNNDGFVEDENGKPLTLRINTIGTQSIQATTAEVIKNNLAKIGIKLDIIASDVPTWVNIGQKLLDKWELTLLNQGSIASASGREYSIHDFVKQLNHMEKSSTYKDYYDNWISPLSKTIEYKAWMDKFRQLEPQLMTKYLYWYPLDQTLDLSFHVSNLQNFKRISWSTWYTKDVYFK